jgi:hypothetical protein
MDCASPELSNFPAMLTKWFGSTRPGVERFGCSWEAEVLLIAVAGAILAAASTIELELSLRRGLGQAT